MDKEELYEKWVVENAIFTCLKCLTQYETEKEAKDCFDSHVKDNEIGPEDEP